MTTINVGKLLGVRPDVVPVDGPKYLNITASTGGVDQGCAGAVEWTGVGFAYGSPSHIQQFPYQFFINDVAVINPLTETSVFMLSSTSGSGYFPNDGDNLNVALSDFGLMVQFDIDVGEEFFAVISNTTSDYIKVKIVQEDGRDILHAEPMNYSPDGNQSWLLTGDLNHPPTEVRFCLAPGGGVGNV